jgi:hypothetical protein
MLGELAPKHMKILLGLLALQRSDVTRAVFCVASSLFLMHWRIINTVKLAEGVLDATPPPPGARAKFRGS